MNDRVNQQATTAGNQQAGEPSSQRNLTASDFQPQPTVAGRGQGEAGIGAGPASKDRPETVAASESASTSRLPKEGHVPAAPADVRPVVSTRQVESLGGYIENAGAPAVVRDTARSQADATSGRTDTMLRSAEAHPEVDPLSAAMARRRLELQTRLDASFTRVGDHYVSLQGREAFREEPNKLTTTEFNSLGLRAMVDAAEVKGWTYLRVGGDAQFQRSAYIEATSRGLQVTTESYRVTAADRRMAEELAASRGSDRSPVGLVPERSSQATEAKAVSPSPAPVGILESATARQPISEQPGATALAAAQPSVGPDAQRGRGAGAIAGILVDHGPAPYLHNKDNSLSYYAVLRDPNGVDRVEWGVGIPDALKKAGARVGDEVALRRGEKQDVLVPEVVRLPGQPPREVEKVAQRFEWHAEVRGVPNIGANAVSSGREATHPAVEAVAPPHVGIGASPLRSQAPQHSSGGDAAPARQENSPSLAGIVARGEKIAERPDGEMSARSALNAVRGDASLFQRINDPAERAEAARIIEANGLSQPAYQKALAKHAPEVQVEVARLREQGGAKKDEQGIRPTEAATGAAHAVQVTGAGGPAVQQASAALGAVDAVAVGAKIARGENVRAIDLAAAGASVAIATQVGGEAGQTAAKAVGAVGAVDAADRLTKAPQQAHGDVERPPALNAAERRVEQAKVVIEADANRPLIERANPMGSSRAERDDFRKEHGLPEQWDGVQKANSTRRDLVRGNSEVVRDTPAVAAVRAIAADQGVSPALVEQVVGEARRREAQAHSEGKEVRVAIYDAQRGQPQSSRAAASPDAAAAKAVERPGQSIQPGVER